MPEEQKTAHLSVFQRTALPFEEKEPHEQKEAKNFEEYEDASEMKLKSRRS